MVETSPPIITTFPNVLFKVTCNVKAESAGNPLNATIEWTRISFSINSTNIIFVKRHVMCTPKNPYCSNFSSHEGNDSKSRSGARSSRYNNFHYHHVLQSAENGTVGVIIYRCNATTQNISIFSNTNVLLSNSSKLFQFNSLTTLFFITKCTGSSMIAPLITSDRVSPVIYASSSSLDLLMTSTNYIVASSTLPHTITADVLSSTTVFSDTMSSTFINCSPTSSVIEGSIIHPTFSEPTASSGFWCLLIVLILLFSMYVHR